MIFGRRSRQDFNYQFDRDPTAFDSNRRNQARVRHHRYHQGRGTSGFEDHINNEPQSYRQSGSERSYWNPSRTDTSWDESSYPQSDHYARNQEFGRYEGTSATDQYEGLSTGFSGPFRDEPSGRRDDQPSYIGKGPKGYRRSDERIKDDVCYSLMQSPHVDASQIEVRVDQGVVTLTGAVPDRKMKRLAEDAIDDVQGISDVHNQIEVKIQSSN